MGLISQVQSSIQNAAKGELLRSGISVALLGAPNAGKSSLFNSIVGREAAIVSHEEGTTRDAIEVGVDIGGFYCRFEDLAGIRRGLKHGENSESLSTGTAMGQAEEEGIPGGQEG